MGLEPINFPLFDRLWRAFSGLLMVRFACSSPLFAEDVSMRRLQSVANSGLVLRHPGLYCQRHQHPEVRI